MQIRLVLVFAVVFVLLSSAAMAVPVNIVDPRFAHFANFANDFPAQELSHISSATSAIADFGWHSGLDGFPDYPKYAGILFDETHLVTGLNFQVHSNPLKDFVLQGSTDTINGLDGNWSDVFSSTVTERQELAWQEWVFPNTSAFSAYRIMILNDYIDYDNAFAMYRWQLLEDAGTTPGSPVPEPGTMVLLGSALIGLATWKRKDRKG